MKQLLEKLSQLNIEISITGDNLHIKAPKGVITPEISGEIKQNKPELIKYFRSYQQDDLIPKAGEQNFYPVSSAQKRLWLLNQINPNDPSYHVPLIFEMVGSPDPEHLKSAFEYIIDRHEILRTSFTADAAGRPVQVVRTRSEMAFDIDFRPVSAEAAASEIRQYISLPFDLGRDCLLRVSVMQTGSSRSILVIVMHHIICDGWSLEILANEFREAFDCVEKGIAFDKAPLEIHYKDFAVWQQDQLASPGAGKSRKYWLDMFSGSIPVLELPACRPRPKLKSGHGRTLSFEFDREVFASYKSICVKHNTTLFAGVMTLADIVLHKYSGQEDIVVGIPVANRGPANLQNQIGFYVNTLAIKTRMRADASFSDLLNNKKVQLLHAYEHQDFPFDELVSCLDLEFDTSRNPLFETMVTLQEESGIEMAEVGSLKLKKIFAENYTSKFDLAFSFYITGGNLKLSLSYNTDIFDENFIRCIFLLLERLMAKVTQSENMPLAEMLLPGNGNHVSFDSASFFETAPEPQPSNAYDKWELDDFDTITGRLKAMTSRFPDRNAIIDEHGSITYRMLDYKTNIIARKISELNRNNSNVLLFLSHNSNAVAGIISVLKSGNTYIPVSSGLGFNRIAEIMEETGADLVLCDNGTFGYFMENIGQYGFSPGCLNLDGDIDFEASADMMPDPGIRGDSLAYILFTSGSTGKPKGVMQTHKNVLHYINIYTDRLHISADDRLSLIPYYNFDSAVMDIFGALLNGASLYVYDFKLAGPEKLKDWLNNHKISIIHFTPTHYRTFARTLEEDDVFLYLRLLVLGGEQVFKSDFEVFKRHFTQEAIFVNGYGPTEATIVAQKFMNRNSSLNSVNLPIGRAVDRTEILLLNKWGSVAGLYEEGEILYLSDFLSVGYFKDADLTNEKYKTCTAPGFRENKKYYYSGDQGRLLPDGSIEFLGRKDHQVKIKGLRIELEDIEKTIYRFYDKIKQAVVDAKEVGGEKKLVAYYVLETGHRLEKTVLRTYLQNNLPNCMVPNFFVELDHIPLTASGKIDRKELPAVLDEDLIRRPFVAPASQLEQSLAGILQEVLDVERISVTDSFFELGGHSLMVSQVLSRIRQKLGLTISFRDFFSNPTIQGLSQQLSGLSVTAIEKAPAGKSYPLTPAQQRFWILEVLGAAKNTYNITGVVCLKGDLNEAFLETAFLRLIEKYEILRTYFRVDDVSGEVRQQILPKEEVVFRLERHILSNEEELSGLPAALNNVSFNLEEPILLKASLIRRENGDYLLAVVIHHIICDGWSAQIMVSEIVETYNLLYENTDCPPAPIAIQYKDYAVWLQQEMKTGKYDAAEQYWLSRFAGALPVLELPGFKKRPPVKTYHGAGRTSLFSEEFSRRLRQYAEKGQSTVFMILMAGVKALMYLYSGQKDMIIGTPVAGREHPALEDQIGLFLNTLAIRTQLGDRNSFATLLAQVKQSLLDAYEHQHYPFDQLVDKLRLTRDSSRSVLFDVLVVYQNHTKLKTGNRGHTFKGIYAEKFDHEITTTQHDLTYIFFEEQGRLGLGIEFNTDVFDSSFVENMFSHLETLLAAAMEHSAACLEDAGFLTKLGSLGKYIGAGRYWSAQLAGCQPVPELPSERPRQNDLTYAGSEIQYSYPPAFARQLAGFSAALNTTSFVLLLAGVRALLSRYTAQADSIIGTQVAGTNPGLLPLRNIIGTEDTFCELVENEQQTLSGALDHRDYPVNELARLVCEQANCHVRPADVVVMLQDGQLMPDPATLQQSGISFIFRETEEGLLLAIRYGTDIYDHAFISRIPVHLERMLENGMLNPQKQISRIDFLDSPERYRLLYEFNDTSLEYDALKTAVDLFEEQVNKTPGHIAVTCNDTQFTYRELNDLANSFSMYLRRKYKTGKDDLVPVVLFPSERVIVSVIAILKAGGAYVPIDPNYPLEKKNYILEDINPAVVIDEDEYDSFLRDMPEEKAAYLPARIAPSDLAYVIYTSGTTGHPKGVMIEHRNICSRIIYYNKMYSLDENGCYLFYRSFSFDGAIEEYLVPLFSGGNVIVLDNERKQHIYREIAGIIRDNGVTKICLPPGLLTELLANADQTGFGGFKDLKQVISGGDVLNTHHLGKLDKHIAIHNTYGPTEGTIDSTNWVVDLARNTKNSIIGKPIFNTQAYILDDHLEPVPVGVWGTLFISGAGIARGYLNQPELTALKFITNPFKERSVMYNTGDICRWLEDGNIEFLGRIDQQVKIRGYRIELGEIEAAIQKFSGNFNQVVVDARTYKDEKVLAAYIVSEKRLDKDALQYYLQQHLPAYMIPSYYFEMDRIPVNFNGKIDRKQLPDIAAETLTRRQYIAPATDTEQQLADIWEAVLGVEPVGTADNFFELGGHSLKAITILGKIQITFGVKLKLQSIFSATVKELAAEIDNLKANDPSAKLQAVRIPISNIAEANISVFQRRLWLLESFSKKMRLNISGNIRSDEVFDYSRLMSVVRRMAGMHSALRTVFIDEEMQPKQRILAMDEVDFNEIVQVAYSYDDFTELRHDIGARIHFYAFPLFRMVVHPLEQGGFLLHVNIHHVICDGWSLEILLKQFSDLYTSGIPVTPPQPLPQYIDYTLWLEDNIGNIGGEQLQYWKHRLDGCSPYTRLPYNKVKKAGEPEGAPGLVKLFFDRDTRESIRQVCIAGNTSYVSFFLACFKILAGRILHLNDVTIGLIVSNRNLPFTQDIVGYFVNFIFQRDQIHPGETFIDFLKKLSQSLAEGLDNQNVPYESVLDAIGLPNRPDRSPLTSIFFNSVDFNNTEETAYEAQEDSPYRTANFEVELYARNYTNGTLISCVFDQNLYTREIIEYWMEGYKALVAEVLTDIHTRCAGFNIFNYLPSAPVSIAPDRSFRTWSREDREGTIIQKFENIVRAFPDNIAISQEEDITYARLKTRVDAVASNIIQQLQAPGHVILFLDHGINAVTGILAALKCGCSYVPVDISAPAERLATLLGDIPYRIVLTSGKTYELVCGFRHLLAAEALILNIDDLAFIATTDKWAAAGNPGDLAYILFTSGSTGRPKGVMQTHANVLHHISTYSHRLGIGPDDKLSLVPYYYFDASVMDIFGALLNGATLYPYDIQEMGPGHMYDWISANRITIFHVVPTIFRHLVRYGGENAGPASVRLVVLGGEEVFTSDYLDFRKLFGSDTGFINGYGPTESTLTMQKILDHGNGDLYGYKVPLGLPVEDTEIFLRKPDGKIARIYEEGEIVYRSRYLALGYYNDTVLTDEKFKTDNEDGNYRLYFSGDIGKQLPNGEIVFCRRNDSQVKLNGVRIEPGEIEYHLLDLEEVMNAVVIPEPDSLAAFVQLREGGKPDRMRITGHLKRKLPTYMVPGEINFIQAFPKTNTGKIDRNALRGMARTLQENNTRNLQAPGNETEQKLVQIWQKALGLTIHSTDDDFFRLGGNSFKILELNYWIGREFSMRFDIKSLYTLTTIQTQAAAIIAHTENTAGRMSVQHAPEDKALAHPNAPEYFYKPSHQQVRAYNDIRSDYLGNLLYRFDLPRKIKVEKVVSAIEELVKNAEVFRTVFYEQQDALVARVLPEGQPVASYMEVLPADADVEKVTGEMNFDLDRFPLFRFFLAVDSGECVAIHFYVNHIIFDGFSTKLLYRDLTSLIHEQPVEINQYSDYARRQEAAYMVTAEKATYWKTIIGKDYYMPVYNPADSHIAGYKTVIENKADVDFSHIMSRYLIWIDETFNIKSPLIQYSSLGRQIGDRLFFNTIGFFANLLFLRVDAPAAYEFDALRETVKTQLSENLVNEIAFEDILQINGLTKLLPFYINVQYGEISDDEKSAGEVLFVPKKKYLTTFKVGLFIRISPSHISIMAQYDTGFVGESNKIANLTNSLNH